ncbi:ankyrin repeat and SOCS box protein 2 isoform X1 [Stegostoma tigrinum]|uniref:ankyrin repeat and SOCS box protein 2 isoform X1 n=1 Tax=Stegostoma tigrinum TaxID=3053191 RepID=UPI00202B6D17|nr:ankyrin repeat and SOCS box protein 2 isoform X1 [Stegostoma tigrinum]XP_048393898.1 ankyrin repeat and SOCS box protein 2 isoform X1 [Stegostoma tigrinum]
MATGVTSSRTFGQEEYSLYSSLSEEELIQMAVEQSLETQPASVQPQGPRGQTHPRNRAQAQVTSRVVQTAVAQACPKNRWVSRSPVTNSAPTANPPRTNRFDGRLIRPPKPVVEPDPVVVAIKNGDEQTLSNMIKAGKVLSEPNSDGWIPLHEAAFYNKPGCVKLLLRAYPGTVDYRTLAEETPLYLATCKEHLECMKYLLEARADCDITSKAKETALYKACERKNVEAVKLLIQYNADVNHRCNRGWTALHEAAVRSDLDIIEALCMAGAKIEASNIYGITPLFVAAQSGQLESLRFLTKCGANINTQANDSASALYEASKNEHEDVVAFLLSQNADANKGSKDGWLPLHIAAARGNMAIVRMLIPVTSKVRVRRSGISPLHLAAQHNRNDIIEELIETGYPISALLSPERSRLFEDKRTSVLYFAVYNNNVEATEMLLKAGANPNVDLINPLLISIRQGSIKNIQLLIDYGANINAYIPTHPTSFPATIMFSMKYLSLLKLIMDFGGDGESCFKCVYGSHQHPEQEQRRDDIQVQHKKPRPVQFCEMVSTPGIYRWAGPIIDVLLDYVGNVNLCSKLKEHLDSYDEWATIKIKSEPPRPLVHLCRIKIRKLLGRQRLKFIEMLPLPGRLKSYLEYNCADELM